MQRRAGIATVAPPGARWHNARMEKATLEQQREWVRIWKETGPLLEQFKKEELRAAEIKESPEILTRL